MPTARKFSRKREAILGALRSTKSHPSADQVWDSLRGDYPELSLGTVYRNLAMFRDEGAIISVGVVDGHERFDADTSPHAHFVCKRCGAVLDIELPSVPFTLSDVGEKNGVVVTRSELTYYGYCKSCCKQAERPLNQ